MAVNLSTLAGKPSRIEVPFMGQTAKVHYDPLALTQGSIEKAKAKGDEGFIEFLCGTIKSWDVKKGNKVIPLTPAGVKQVPMVLLRAIYAGMLTEGGGEEEEGKASNDG